VLLDAYNANPSSMKAAINSFIGVKASHKTVILGDMLELGDFSIAEHESVIDQLEEAKFDEVILVGPLFSSFKKATNRSHFESTLAAKKHLKENPIKGSTILIKRSRGIALEQLLDQL